MAKKANRQPKEYELDFRKVRDIMKKLNVKKMNMDSVKQIAKELSFDIESKPRAAHLRGKMLASINAWNKN